VLATHEQAPYNDVCSLKRPDTYSSLHAITILQPTDFDALLFAQALATLMEHL
jgi:hypothetical protein